MSGPYGDNPYGGDPQGGNPYGANPYGGNPYGANPYGGDPYAASPYGGYGPGQPPAWPGQVPPGGPGRRGPSAVVIGLIAALVAVVAVAAVLFARARGDHSASSPSSSMVPAGPSNMPSRSTTASAPRTTASAPPAGQNAKDCTPNVSAGQQPAGGVLSAGGLSFPASVAPGWTPISDRVMPNAIDGVAMTQTVSEGWGAQISVGITNFDQQMSLADQANLMLKCVVASEMYSAASPRPGKPDVTSTDVDGVPASRLTVTIPVTTSDPSVKGDDVVLIVVGTKPSTYFLGVSPIGDAARGNVVKAAVQALKVKK